MIRSTLIAIALVAAPIAVSASGANTKTGIGDKNDKGCDPGFYLDTTSGSCISANWK